MNGKSNVWQIDAAHTSVGFSARFLEISNVKGGFSKVAGRLEYDFDNPAAIKLEAEIEVDSISTHNELRDKHLKEETMFFDRANHKTIRFEADRAEVVGVGKLKVFGEMTMRGVTKPAVFDVEGPTHEVADPLTGKIKMAAFANTTINRNDFGMTMPAVMEFGEILIGDKVEISIDAVFEKQSAADQIKK